MTEKTDKIVEALRKLDTANDAHWTTDGLPRLETVKFLAGDQSLTRDDVTTAASGFTRTNTDIADPEATPPENADGVNPQTEPPVVSTGADGSVDIEGARDIGAGGYLEGVDAEGDLSGHTEQEARELGLIQPPSGEQPETGDLSVTPPEEPTVGGELPTERTPANGQDPSLHPAPATEGHVGPREDDFPASPNAETESDQVADFVYHDSDETSGLQEDLEAAEARIADLTQDRDTVNRLLAEANADADRIRDKMTTARGSSDTTNVILQALESRKRQAEQRGEVQASLKASGVDLKALAKAASKAPIDQAMARKTGRGGTRPVHR